ncbi:sigma factor-like helix-turn-helix DNA-binding protein [Nocardia sp. NPDC051990]|uniref:sigma factor-like helix-turn-helix DNA-binding protein n=1 Tax=Nocardia sp. NPDC051990 TaxID=3155285 RepID=UPI00342725C8
MDELIQQIAGGRIVGTVRIDRSGVGEQGEGRCGQDQVRQGVGEVGVPLGSDDGDLCAEEVEDQAAGGSEAAHNRDPESEALLIDAVGRALLVVLDTLGPDERVAFVLHDMFAVPFDQIAPIVGRTSAATKKLASRARSRAHGDATATTAELAEQRQVVDAFLAAARNGDLDALLAVLAPDVVRTADPAALPAGMAPVARGAQAVARETVILRRRSQVATLALVDGAVGIIVAPRGKLLLALVVRVEDHRIASYEVIADPARLRQLDIDVLPELP